MFRSIMFYFMSCFGNVLEGRLTRKTKQNDRQNSVESVNPVRPIKLAKSVKPATFIKSTEPIKLEDAEKFAHH